MDPQVTLFTAPSSDVGEMAIREAPRFPLGICHNNSSGKRHACARVDGWMVAIFNSWGGIWVGFEVVSSENRYTFDVCVIIHILCVQYILREFDHISYTSSSIYPVNDFWLVQHHHLTCPTQGMQWASQYTAWYWTISTRVLIGIRTKKWQLHNSRNL